MRKHYTMDRVGSARAHHALSGLQRYEAREPGFEVRDFPGTLGSAHFSLIMRRTFPSASTQMQHRQKADAWARSHPPTRHLRP